MSPYPAICIINSLLQSAESTLENVQNRTQNKQIGKISQKSTKKNATQKYVVNLVRREEWIDCDANGLDSKIIQSEIDAGVMS